MSVGCVVARLSFIQMTPLLHGHYREKRPLSTTLLVPGGKARPAGGLYEKPGARTCLVGHMQSDHLYPKNANGRAENRVVLLRRKHLRINGFSPGRSIAERWD